MKDEKNKLSNWTFGLALIMLVATAIFASTDLLFVANLLFTLSFILHDI